VAFALLALAAPVARGAEATPAFPAALGFPGAEGFGATTVGGRAGVVLRVTNLKDDGPGSLRAAVETPGPRIIVFQVGGTIELASSIEIQNPYVTIAGQTAPGDGITLRNDPNNSRTPLKIETHDVIVRYLRSRPGSHPDEIGTLDALTISNEHGELYNVIVDHCSFSWATDELVNLYYAAHDVTVQWSILSEALDCSTHIENGERQCHSMAMLLGSEGSANFSIHHNLFAHNRHRNPRVKTMGTVDVVNNVVYNSGWGNGWRSPTYVHGGHAIVPANYVGNTFTPGPDSGAAQWFIDTKEVVMVYADGNAVPHQLLDTASLDMLVQNRHAAPPVTTWSAARARFLVLTSAGANRGLRCDGTPYRRQDAVDWRVVLEALLGGGRIIDEAWHVGGWPDLAGGQPCQDLDADGMPDAFEERFGFDPSDPNDGWADADEDGYTNVEEFLNFSPPHAAD
jgi:pectate lyase